jgi:hypothetical protein
MSDPYARLQVTTTKGKTMNFTPDELSLIVDALDFYSDNSSHGLGALSMISEIVSRIQEMEN